jgi:hypothetical protein
VCLNSEKPEFSLRKSVESLRCSVESAKNGAVGSCPHVSGSDPARIVIRILDMAERCLALVERGSLSPLAAPGGSVGYGDVLGR